MVVMTYFVIVIFIPVLFLNIYLAVRYFRLSKALEKNPGNQDLQSDLYLVNLISRVSLVLFSVLFLISKIF